MPIEQKKVTQLDAPSGGIADNDLFYMVDMDGDGGNPKGTKVTAQEVAEYTRFASAGLDLWVIKRTVYRNLNADTFGDQLSSIGGTYTNSVATADQPQMSNIATSTVVNNAAGQTGSTDYWFNRRLWLTSIAKAINSDARYWVGVLTDLSGAALAASATPVGNLVGFRYDPGAGDVNWQFCQSDGVTFSAQDTGIAPRFSSTPQLFEYRLTASDTISVYFDRELVLSGISRVTSNTTGLSIAHTVTNLPGVSAKNLRWLQTQVAQYYL